MASVINPQYADGTNLREWPLDVTEDLIRRRRFYKEEFYTTRLRDQAEFWFRISLFIYNTYFLDVSVAQCRQKWNALVSGYENLKRLINDNPEGYRTFTPSFYDRHFYNEMSDEFWKNPSNYLFILFIYLFYLIQYIIHIIYFFLGRPAVAHRRNNIDRRRNSYRNCRRSRSRSSNRRSRRSHHSRSQSKSNRRSHHSRS